MFTRLLKDFTTVFIEGTSERVESGQMWPQKEGEARLSTRQQTGDQVTRGSDAIALGGSCIISGEHGKGHVHLVVCLVCSMSGF